MTLARNLPLAEVTEKALRLLIRDIGIVNTARFINQFHMGTGDAVAEKEQLFGTMTVEEIATGIKRSKRPRST